jgi:hypothetical protein
VIELGTRRLIALAGLAALIGIWLGATIFHALT